MKPKVVNGPNAGLIAFLYELLRDHLPAAKIEEVTRNSEGHTEYTLSNGHLAEYAAEVAERLMKMPKNKGRKKVNSTFAKFGN